MHYLMHTYKVKIELHKINERVRARKTLVWVGGWVVSGERGEAIALYLV